MPLVPIDGGGTSHWKLLRVVCICQHILVQGVIVASMMLFAFFIESDIIIFADAALVFRSGFTLIFRLREVTIHYET